MHLTTQPAVF